MPYRNTTPTSLTSATTLSLPAIVVAMAFTSCKKDKADPLDPAPPTNEEEVITTLGLHFHSTGGAEHKHFIFQDLDGDGGSAPVITADTLSADSIYSVGIEVLDESSGSVQDLTGEIGSEGEAHQFFYQSMGANVVVEYADVDANGQPIGLESTWTAGAASNGSIVVTLRHGPDKSAAGVSDGDITNAGGETDIEVVFPVAIE